MTSRGSCIGLRPARRGFARAKFKSANFSANTAFWVRGVMTKIVPHDMKNLLQGSVEGRFTCPLNCTAHRRNKFLLIKIN